MSNVGPVFSSTNFFDIYIPFFSWSSALFLIPILTSNILFNTVLLLSWLIDWCDRLLFHFSCPLAWYLCTIFCELNCCSSISSNFLSTILYFKRFYFPAVFSLFYFRFRFHYNWRYFQIQWSHVCSFHHL